MNVTLEDIYVYLNEDIVTNEQLPLVGVDLDDLPQAINKLSEESKKELEKSARIFKRTEAIRRMAPSSAKLVSIALPSPENRVTREISKSSKAATKGYYAGIFDSNAKEENYTKAVWAVRQEFLQELQVLQNNGGCSGCKRGALIRKYTKKLQEMDL